MDKKVNFNNTQLLSMTRILLCYVLTVLLFVPLSVHGQKNFEVEIDKGFSELKNQNVPGVATAVIKDGEVIYLKGFGIANMETESRITPQTKFQLGEMSKQFTSLAILIMENQGKIKLTDDIRKHLPELPKYAHTVTIDHLLNHCSGLHDVARISTLLHGTPVISTQAKAIEMIASQKTLTFKPGTDFSFHEAVTESVLMAEIVARSSEQSFAAFVKDNIFAPLGMNNSLIRDDSNIIIDDVAEPYQKEEQEEDYKRNPVASSVVGAINAYTSAEDLSKWYLQFSHPKGTLGRMIQKLDTPVKLSNGDKFNYYWGDMAMGREFKHPERGLPKYWNFGLQGGYGTNIFRFMDQGITAFVLGNNNDYNGGFIMDAIDPFLKDLYTFPETIDFDKLKTKKVSNQKLESYTGHYWFKHAGYPSELYVENDTLRSRWAFSTRHVKLLPIADGVFQRMVGNEDVIKFEFKKEGEDMRLYFTYNDAKPDIMERIERVTLSADELESYAGTYYNAEYASLLTLHRENDELVFRNSGHKIPEFKPVQKDVFSSPTLFIPGIQFIRDQSGEIEGFAVDADGIHNLVFKKIK